MMCPRRRMVRWLCFGVGFVVLDWLSYAALTAAFRRTTTGESFGGYVNAARQAKADVVVLGSSRAQCHFNPVVLETYLPGMTVYNAGSNGQGLPYVRGVEDLLLATYRPKLFIINVDATSLAARLDNPDFTRLTRLSTFIDESAVVRDLIWSRSRWERLKYLCRTFRFNGKALAILASQRAADSTVQGFTPLRSVMKAEDVRDPFVYENVTQTTGDPRLVDLLRDTIRVGRAARVAIVVVNTPRWSKDLRSDPRLVNLFTLLESVVREEGGIYVSLSLENTTELRDPSLYQDASHLNAKGADVVSRLLGEALTRKGLAPLRNVGL
jgi:hypothetical protein